MQRGFLLKNKIVPHADTARHRESDHRCSAPEHVVFCLMASRLTHLTNKASVLCLCQNQERVAGQLYLHTITEVSACTWALNDPFFRLLRLTRYSHRQPVRTTLEMYRRDLVWHRLRKFLCIWRAVTFLFPKL